jgi:hypothetical protein
VFVSTATGKTIYLTGLDSFLSTFERVERARASDQMLIKMTSKDLADVVKNGRLRIDCNDDRHTHPFENLANNLRMASTYKNQLHLMSRALTQELFEPVFRQFVHHAQFNVFKGKKESVFGWTLGSV